MTEPIETFLTPVEVAAIFRVDAKTIARWAAAGKLPFVPTPSGRRLFAESVVRALLAGGVT